MKKATEPIVRKTGPGSGHRRKGSPAEQPCAGPLSQIAASLAGSPVVQAQAQMAEWMNTDAFADTATQLAAGPDACPEGETASGEETVQLKRQIRGAQSFRQRGRMTVNFEERIKGSAGGMYGSIAFMPAEGGTRADKIDLVQIASLMTNVRGQREYEAETAAREERERGSARAPAVGGASSSSEPPPAIREKDIDSSGNAPVKDMVRGTTYEGFHIDLTFDKSRPRTDRRDPVLESAYNAERRGGGWEDPMDVLMMGRSDEVLNEYSLREQDITTRRVDQDPGFNRGGRRVKETELIDFPVSSEPSEFSFETEINADGANWGTAEWGFRTLYDHMNGQNFVSDVYGPNFIDGRSAAMDEARKAFNAIFANPSAWTSPEALAETTRLLGSRNDREHRQGRDDLMEMTHDLEQALRTIKRLARGDLDLMKRMAGPHLATARQVLELADRHAIENQVVVRLIERYEEISKDLS